ncbi:hypothetical protein COCC4DRAFT_130504 [Bipolaris maydis ATCC 48331]|uniref:Small nuclear ribonucleoprotein Prp3 C-terminal domain-containing protein n=2 Tax=Cochliobolus heterostrophus TaxID=5016 RepID=M2UX52_COCH5|nr:uncharacterized protein COCC4DRAFT_130504 [Bipolaris maydis ATCC 48331]EMD92393.1 hypothetical protein COCHEDRAFT_1213449 [Bipolaris maydis C5]KAJ5022225.1 hypothetical protein J3E73DRAFT_401902 [Bipolaris maydis]ENI08084.1 hypothetical protein COCC4DRAFT_130504 [Bipolaris maydis ATCC 48331]KAJ5060917.1 hypothetical protein J3E74DRAFT_450840 [Bipolaris maydis]KAJ6198049.1 hypothetical protein J3E72DRAFT_417006 [Bipolaris maydis]
MDSHWHLLPPDLLELQIGQIDLLLAMYPDDLTLSDAAHSTLSVLRNGDAEKSQEAVTCTPSISATLDLSISPPPETSPQASPQTLRLHLTIPFAYQSAATTTTTPTDPPPVKVRVQQPTWLNKAETQSLTSSLPNPDDLLDTLNLILEKASAHLSSSSSSSPSPSPSPQSCSPLVRAWFLFPSISTRSKRLDLTTHAPRYALTGFLFAGKPGLLCVEGASANIDAYMRFIKTESWGDIPAYQKKVSERWREVGVQARVFEGMEEITDAVGERRGERGMRGDMGGLEEWLVRRGVGEAFARVLM